MLSRLEQFLTNTIREYFNRRHEHCAVCWSRSPINALSSSKSVRWPSWLWRQVKVNLNTNSWWSNPPGFESQSHQVLLFAFPPFYIQFLLKKHELTEVAVPLDSVSSCWKLEQDPCTPQLTMTI